MQNQKAKDIENQIGNMKSVSDDFSSYVDVNQAISPTAKTHKSSDSSNKSNPNNPTTSLLDKENTDTAIIRNKNDLNIDDKLSMVPESTSKNPSQAQKTSSSTSTEEDDFHKEFNKTKCCYKTTYCLSFYLPVITTFILTALAILTNLNDCKKSEKCINDFNVAELLTGSIVSTITVISGISNKLLKKSLETQIDVGFNNKKFPLFRHIPRRNEQEKQKARDIVRSFYSL